MQQLQPAPQRNIPVHPHVSTRDRLRESAREKSHFAKIRHAEHSYAAALRGVAAQIGKFIRGFLKADQPPAAEDVGLAIRQLETYSATIEPWARAIARRMLADVSRRDAGAWSKLARTMSRSLRREIETAPTGNVMREALERQVHYITSLPLDAARRVQQIATGHLYSGLRAGEIRGDSEKARGLAAEILRTGEVSVGRANTIARTATTRAASELMRVRAEHVGSEGFIWRTARDRDVRPLHRKLEGRFFRWDDPPVIGENDERGAPGTIYNCRCYAEPVLPERIL